MEETQETATQSEHDDAASELQRLTAENEALKNEIRMRSATYEIEARLKAAGARSPRLLVKEAREAFQFGEDGTLSNAGDLIAQLRRSYPEQFGLDHSNAGSIDAAAGRNPAPPLTREALGRMTPAEIRELEWEEVRAALAGQ